MAQQKNYAEKMAGEIVKQMESTMAFADLYQKQAEKIAGMWMDQNLAAMKEAQGFAKEWLGLGKKTGAEIMQAFTTGVAEGAKLFAPPA